MPQKNDPRHSDDVGSAEKLLMELRTNDVDGYQSCGALGIQELGRDVAAEVESEWIELLLVEVKRDRLIGWQLGVSL